MQFIKNGPDIPERLLREHEDGNVVFFCGAGISYPAGLPGFAGLTKSLFDNLKVEPNRVEWSAICAYRFDTAISLLEGRIAGGRVRVRKELANILAVRRNAPTETHEALLTLGKTRKRDNHEGRMHLVTTNFDRLFEKAMAKKNLSVERCLAPRLPIPKNRWDGLVYLHGLLTDQQTEDDLDNLVVSSGDFGLAYLTERWAARFMSELFRKYIVCFVGYSIDDPVLRYMMDSLAADRQLGEIPHEMFAFGSYLKDKRDETIEDWKAKNVTPILYREDEEHTYLHETLHSWAKTYRDGVLGKERIVADLAHVPPSDSTQEDDFVGRMLWALSDPTGLPAKRFARYDPAPSLDWLLEPLSQNRFHHDDLFRFGVTPKPKVDEELAFSMIQRPAPYSLAPWINIVDAGAHRSGWDDVMYHLAYWLTRHLNDPKLLLWFSERGGQLHHRFVRMLEASLDELVERDQEEETNHLSHIYESAPRETPSQLMRKLWRLLLSGRVISQRNADMYQWRNRFWRDGFTPISRLELRKYLTPHVLLSDPLYGMDEAGDSREAESIRELVHWEIELAALNVHECIRDLSRNSQWKKALPELLPDFTDLLRETLDLMGELEGADERSDLSYVCQPSISEHSQNTTTHDWTALIVLTRDAWLAINEQHPEQAALEVKRWRKIRYPVFRRLELFAMKVWAERE